jgi:pimeloyl-ACP methyl ester carboxylesterase
MAIRSRPPGARRKRQLRDDLPSVSHGFVQASDGTRLFYSVEGKGKPLIFCYGLVCSSLHWTYQIEHFRKNYRSIWFDYRGHHNSQTPKDLNSLTLENIAADARLILDQLGIQDAVFLGHSMGVNVVLEIYRQDPKRVHAMILSNGTARRPLETLFNSNWTEGVFDFFHKAHAFSPKLVKMLWAAQRRNPLAWSLLALGGFNPHLTPAADIQLYADQISEMDPAILLHLIRSYDRYDATAWLHTVQCPTLVLAGEHDKITPIAQQELIHQLIPDSTLEIIRHGSHCPQMDLPDEVNLRIARFLERLNYG